MKKTPLKKAYCPFCYGPVASANDPYGDQVPKGGDYAVCQFCGELSVFTASKGLRRPNEKERGPISNHAPAQALKRSWKDNHP